METGQLQLHIERWAENRAVQSFKIGDVDDYFLAPWRKNAIRHGIANGVMDGYEHGLTGVFSFVKLFNLGLPLEQAAPRLHQVTPLLKDIYTRIADAAMNAVAPMPDAALTPAQREILALLRRHKTNGEIAQLMGKSPVTVKTQVQDMLRRTGLVNRHALAASAY